ncbi:MAG: DUF2752 domain-containing protein [Armatimonadetes bacterium]|nr:DUF2752 domain-containing protein [Armatimonadota bacterium]
MAVNRDSFFLLFLSIGFLSLMYWVSPTGSGILPPCLFFLATGGKYCPGCGTLRCFHAFLHGRLTQAAAYNVVTLLSLPWIGLVIANFLSERWIGRPLLRFALPRWVEWAAAGLIILFWILRNIPAYPFSLLAPHEL